jgi:ketosteroid isomerase-like protein
MLTIASLLSYRSNVVTLTRGDLEMTDELDAQLSGLRARVQVIEDHEAIKNLHHRFTRAVANREFESLPGFFTDDAVIDMRGHGEARGIDAITRHFAGMESAPILGAGYVLSSPVLDVTGDSARGEWTWHRFLVDGGWEEGRYRCAYRRAGDGWFISRMHFRVILPHHDDAPVGGEVE